MPLKIIREDITKLSCDAIVNATNKRLLPSNNGVNGAIHRAAGDEFSIECAKLGGCKVGEAKITKGYNLKSRYVIHTVGPKYRGGINHERELLESCYKNCLQLALDYNIESIAFPLIASGTFRFPKDEALSIATDTIRDFLLQHDMLIYLVVFDKESFEISRHLHNDIQSYINDHYASLKYTGRRYESDSFFEERSKSRPDIIARQISVKDLENIISNADEFEPFNYLDNDFNESSISTNVPRDTSEFELKDEYIKEASVTFKSSKPFVDKDYIKAHLEELFSYKDESFSKMLFRKIDESGLKDSEIYRRANMDKRLFSKIRCNDDYKPSKKSVIALAIALKMDLDETKEFLCKAGYALSPAYKFDIIIKFFISNQVYDIFEINNALFERDLPTL